MSVAPAVKAPPWTEAQMKRALWQHFTAQGYAVLEEFTTNDTAATIPGLRSERRIDVLAIRPAKRLDIGPIELLAIEVKVSRSDFLSDVRRPEKQAPWRELAHRHAYAVPEGMVAVDEVPEESGLIEVSRHLPANEYMTARTGVEGRYTAQWTRVIRHKAGHKPPLTGQFVSRIAFRAAAAEATQRGYTYDTTGLTPEEARAEVRRTNAALEKTRNELDRMKDARDAWRAYGLSIAPAATCTACGEPIRPSSWSTRAWFSWRHVDKTHEKVCEEARLEATRADWVAKGYEVGPFLTAPGVTPADLPDLPVGDASE